MLRHVQESARAAGRPNVTTLAGAAEDLDVDAESFDAVIWRLGLMGAWAEVAQALETFETATGFVAPAEVLVAAGARAAAS
jgi:ubiquinone/menaquinone biosynthesis C-methylase UbiE